MCDCNCACLYLGKEMKEEMSDRPHGVRACVRARVHATAVQSARMNDIMSAAGLDRS